MRISKISLRETEWYTSENLVSGVTHESNSDLSSLAPFVFDGENYQAWTIILQADIDGCDYWEAIENNYDVALLFDSPTINQIKTY